ncbi:MAG: hypothetical protein K6T17_07190, partial [Fimbriimonadales bacterium]|nr:hypothetical protein [Fimbriimonadales bacterium]
PPERTYSIISKSDQLHVGDVMLLKVQDDQGNIVDNFRVLWSCSSNGAWIDQGGRLHALAEGTVVVKAIIRGAETVKEFFIRPRGASSLSLAPSASGLARSDTRSTL